MADRKIDIARRWWRPVFAFLATACIAAIVVVVSYLLVTVRATLADAAAILITIVTACATPLGIFIGGRSYEKVNGTYEGDASAYEAYGDSRVIGTASSPQEFQEILRAQGIDVNKNGTDLDEAVFDALEDDLEIPPDPADLPRSIPRRRSSKSGPKE